MICLQSYPQITAEDSMLGVVMNDGRPSRPNSIELRRNYPDQADTGYSPRHVHSPTEMQYRLVVIQFLNIIFMCVTCLVFVNLHANIIR